MKLKKHLFLLFIISVLISSSLFSQSQKKKRLSKHFDKSLDYSAEETNSEYFSKGIFNLDSTSIVDSVIVTRANGNEKKHIYNFDSNGNMTLDLMELWDGINWVKSRRTIYTYDSNENMTLRLFESWDRTKWKNSERESYKYDTYRNMTLRLFELWDATHWVKSSRDSNTYDSYGNITFRLLEDWLDGQLIMMSSRRTTYTYDSNGNITFKLWEFNDGESWRENNTYDFYGNIIERIREKYLENGSQWVNSKRYTYIYDSNENMTLDIREHWIDENWVNSERNIYTYDSDKKIITYLKGHWIDVKWLNSWQYSYSYDPNGNRTLQLFENWDDNGQLTYSERKTSSYNSNGNMTLDLWEKWDFSEWISTQRFTYVFDSNENMTLGLYEYWDGINWVPLSGDGDIDFYDSFGRYYSFWCNEVKVYYSTITDVDNIFISSTNYSLSQNYPNPFNPTTTISYSIPELSNITLKVFDVLGKEIITLVSEQKLKGNYKIEFNASQLPSGTYFYRLQSGNFLETKKLILVK